MMDKPAIGLVTVLYNSNNVLEGFFKSLSQQTFKDYHLFLIDNTPSEETNKLIEQLVTKYPITAYTHIRNTENVGVAKGNNQGITLSLAAGTAYTLLLNNDIEFDNVLLIEEMYNTAINEREPLIVPKILFYDSRKIWMAGGGINKFTGNVFHVGEGKDEDTFNDRKYYDYAPTCFMLIENKIFKEVGIMDEKYFVYYDDTDFIFRCGKKGYKVLYLPNLIILHKVSSSTGGKESTFTIYYSIRNRIYFIKKNLSGLYYIISIFYTTITRIIRYFFYSPAQRASLIKGWRDSSLMFIKK